MIAGSKCEKLEFIINEEELDEITYLLRKSAQEKKAHLINFSTKKNINVEMFYSFLTSALFEDNYMGHLSEDILELMLPNDYDTSDKLRQKFPSMNSKYPENIIKKGIQYILLIW
jgi:hypothetical protein